MAGAISNLLQRRVIVTLGKGGVGRTSVSAAIALVAAGSGMRALIIETDPEQPIAAGYGLKPGLEPVALAHNLWALFLGGQESLEDYLGMAVPGAILRVVRASSLYQYFVSAAPGIRELTMMGKIYHEVERRSKSLPPWDLIVVDAPASGQALSMIRMPFVADETFGKSIVGSEASQVAAFFRDRSKCALIAVTTAEAFAISETLEIHHALEALGLGLAAVIFNRSTAGGFESSDITRMLTRAARGKALKNPGILAEIARKDLKRRNRERRALGLLARQINTPTIQLIDRRGLANRELASELAGQLAHDAKITMAGADVAQGHLP